MDNESFQVDLNVHRRYAYYDGIGILLSVDDDQPRKFLALHIQFLFEVVQ